MGLLDNIADGKYGIGAAAPQCGVQPFLGLSAYFSPLCYLYEDPETLYFVARNMYCKIWCRMNVITGDENCLLYVCKCFESFLLQLDMRLYLHLTRLGISPLQV